MNKNIENIQTIKSIADFVRAGEKHGKSHFLGCEVEHIIVDACDNSVEYCRFDKLPGVCDILAEMAPLYEDAEYALDNIAQKYVKKLSRADCEVSFEPGGQLEVALSPFEKISDIVAAYSKFLKEVEQVCSKYDYSIEFIGVRPDKCALEVPCMRTNRYLAMDARFKSVGTSGPIMMRNSASLQVSVDYDDEADCEKKLRVATCMAPLIYFLFDNSPVFERAKVGSSGLSASGLKVPRRMARYKIWQNSDDDRTGPIKCVFDNFSYEKYAKQALDVPLMYIRGEQENLYDECLATQLNTDFYYGPHAANEAAHNRELTEDEIQHVLSMGFYDARLKYFIELRACDCVPPEYTFAYVALIKGIFYIKKSLNYTYELFAGASEADYQQAGNSLYDKGWEASVYGMSVSDIWNKILSYAHAGLSPEDADYLKPLYKLVQDKKVVYEAADTDFAANDKSFNPLSQTANNTHIQLDYYKNNQGDIDGRVEALKNQKESKAIYGGKIARQGYFSKVFSINDKLLMTDIVSTIHKILDKVIDHYFENKKYADLFGFDDLTKQLINMRPKYSPNIPIARFDIFFDDKTGRFEFCEFNTAGSAAMNEVFHVCKGARKSATFKFLESQLQDANKKIMDFELFGSWCREFISIYEEWCNNTGYKPAGGRGPTFAIVDFLDNCAINDFTHFKESFNELGYNACVVDVHDLVFDGSKLSTKYGTPIDAIYKRVTFDDLAQRYQEDGVQDLIDAVKSEVVCPIDWYSTQIVHSKEICYVLFNEQTRKILTPSEWNFLQLHQPKTFKLDKCVATDEQVINNKNEFLCKPVSSRGAKNIYPGQNYSMSEWRDILEECAENGNYILQKYATQYETPNVCIDPYNDEHTLNPDYKATILPYSNMEGLYCYNGHFAGIYLRQGTGSVNSRNLDNIDCATFYEEWF